MSDIIDVELIEIISKLNKIQVEVGGEKSKEKTTAAVGEDGKIDRFLDLRNQMVI